MATILIINKSSLFNNNNKLWLKLLQFLMNLFGFFSRGGQNRLFSDVCFLSPFFSEHCTVRKKNFHEHPEKE